MGLKDLLQKEKDDGKIARKAVEKLKKDFPWVAEILGGSPANGDDVEVSPGTITIFFHDGKIRFSANVKSAQKTFIGDIGDVLNPWGSINSAFGVGDVSSKRYTERGYTSKDQTGLI